VVATLDVPAPTTDNDLPKAITPTPDISYDDAMHLDHEIDVDIDIDIDAPPSQRSQSPNTRIPTAWELANGIGKGPQTRIVKVKGTA
jgi:hypothetical protein